MADHSRILTHLPRVSVSPPQDARPYEPVCAVFRRYLHGEQLKFTPERAMILDAVLRKEGLFQAEQLVSDLHDLGHRVSRATVYRTLAHLQDAGILKQVFFDNRQSYYEVIAGRQTYDYLICVATGRVIEFNSEKLRKLRDEICREHGFEPLSHQFHVYGLSPEGKVETTGSNGGSAQDRRQSRTAPVRGREPSGSAAGSTVSKAPRMSPK